MCYIKNLHKNDFIYFRIISSVSCVYDIFNLFFFLYKTKNNYLYEALINFYFNAAKTSRLYTSNMRLFQCPAIRNEKIKIALYM